MTKISYTDYINSSGMELSEDRLSEKWAIGVLIVNGKIDKLADQFYEGTKEEQILRVKAANFPETEEGKKMEAKKDDDGEITPKEAKGIVDKMIKKADLLKKKNQDLEAKMKAIVAEKGLGKGSGDPRCVSHLEYALSNAKYKAIEEITKETEGYIDDDLKKRYEAIGKQREGEAKQNLDAEKSEDITKTYISEEEYDKKSEEEKLLYKEESSEEISFDEEGKEQKNKIKVFRPLYKDIEAFKEGFQGAADYKDFQFTEMQDYKLQGDGEMKDKEIPKSVDREKVKIFEWYGDGKMLLVMPYKTEPKTAAEKRAYIYGLYAFTKEVLEDANKFTEVYVTAIGIKYFANMSSSATKKKKLGEAWLAVHKENLCSDNDIKDSIAKQVKKHKTEEKDGDSESGGEGNDKDKSGKDNNSVDYGTAVNSISEMFDVINTTGQDLKPALYEFVTRNASKLGGLTYNDLVVNNYAYVRMSPMLYEWHVNNIRRKFRNNTLNQDEIDTLFSIFE